MNYLPELRCALVEAAHRQCEAGERERQSRPPIGRSSSRWARWRWVVVNLAIGVAGTAVGLTAAGVFQRGTALGPETPPSPSAFEGVAIPRSVQLLPLRVSDPGRGLPWGLRVARTTRGLTCVDLGRVDFGTVGVLGRDGAFANDGRFHPLSENVFDGLGCDVTDARGNGFVNVARQDAPASGLVGGSPSAGGCRPAEEQAPHRLRPRPTRPTCPQADLREIYYGLLGPDAVSITYRTAAGGHQTIPTSGRDGAYLLVLPQATAGCLAPARSGGPRRDECRYRFRGDRGGPKIPSGVITGATYRDGHSCHVPPPGTFGSLFGSCPPVGFVSPQAKQPTQRQLATPIAIRKIAARSYCGAIRGEAVGPCGARVPRGYRRLTGGWPSLLVQISFTSRVAIPNSRSYYEINLALPHSRSCTTGGTGGPTNADIRAGQRVVRRMFVPYRCPGVVHGTVVYAPTVGAASSMPVPGLQGQTGSIPVGRFSFVVP